MTLKKIIAIACCGIMMLSGCGSQCDKSEGCNGDSLTGEAAERKAYADSLVDRMYDDFYANRFDSCIVMGSTALEIYESLHDNDGIGETASTMGNAYQRLGAYTAAIQMTERAIAVDSLIGDHEVMSGDYNSLAAIYIASGKVDEAEKFIREAISHELLTETKERLTVRYGIASEIMTKKGDTEAAIDFAQKGYDLAAEAADTAQMGKRLSQLGDAYAAANELQKAYETYVRAGQFLESVQSLLSVAINEKQTANVLRRMGRVGEAIPHYERALELGHKVGYRLVEMQGMLALAEVLKDVDPARSCKLYAQSYALSDTIHNSQFADLTSSYAIQFETEQKQRVIEEQAAALTLHRWLLASIVMSIAVVVGVSFLYIYYRRLRRERESLELRFSERVVEDMMNLRSETSDSDKEFLVKLAESVARRLSECSLSSTTLADEFCMSQRQFSRRIKMVTGIDTTHYIRAARILHARHLLKDTELSITEIYVQCGFESANYFSRVFHRETGMTPTEYRSASR